MAAQQIQIYIKGGITDAILALTKRGIKTNQPVQLATSYILREPVSTTVVETEYLSDVSEWMAEEPKMVKGFGYPEGTLLHYKFVGEKANGEAA